MGVKFDRVLDGFDGPFEARERPSLPRRRAGVLDDRGAAAIFLHYRTNDAFRAVNLLLAAGEEVRRLKEPFTVNGAKHPAGMFFVTRKDGTLGRLAGSSDAPSARGSSAAPRHRARKRSRQAGADRRCGTATAVPCPRAGRAGSWSSSTSRSRWSTRRSWTREPARSYDVIVLLDGAIGGGRWRRRRGRAPRRGCGRSGCRPSIRGRAAASPRTKTVPSSEGVHGGGRHGAHHRQLTAPGRRWVCPSPTSS